MSQETFIFILTFVGVFATTIALFSSILQLKRKQDAETIFLSQLEKRIDNETRSIFLRNLEEQIKEMEKADSERNSVCWDSLLKLEELSKLMKKSDRKYILEGLHQPTNIGRLKYMNKLLIESDLKK